VAEEMEKESRRPKLDRASLGDIRELVAGHFDVSERTVLRAEGKIRRRK
jgi:hypothetical protein